MIVGESGAKPHYAALMLLLPICFRMFFDMVLRHAVRVVLAVGAVRVIAATPKGAVRAATFLQPALAAGSAGVAFVDGFAVLARCGFIA